MKQQGTFTGWDFVNVWRLNSNNNGFPSLFWQIAQAGNVAFSNITGSSVTINWTRGTASHCIAFIKYGVSTGTQSPVNGITYTASTDWNAKGTEIGSGSGWYCIYNGSDANPSVTLTNLGQRSDYRVEVFEYNGNPGAEAYCTSVGSNTGNIATIPTLGEWGLIVFGGLIAIIAVRKIVVMG
jgi:hypothetical protein